MSSENDTMFRGALAAARFSQNAALRERKKWRPNIKADVNKSTSAELTDAIAPSYRAKN